MAAALDSLSAGHERLPGHRPAADDGASVAAAARRDGHVSHAMSHLCQALHMSTAGRWLLCLRSWGHAYGRAGVLCAAALPQDPDSSPPLQLHADVAQPEESTLARSRAVLAMPLD